MVVQHNMSAMTANRYYTNNNSALGKSMEKLSSGFAINRAGDNAAGLAVSEKMRAQISGLTQASKNAQDGISMVQTFEGALQETDSILQRMRTLAVQSANGSYQSDVDRDAIQLEFDQLNAELNEIADTDYNGVIVLNGGRMADETTTAKKEDGTEVVSDLPTISSPTDATDVKFEYSSSSSGSGSTATNLGTYAGAKAAEGGTATIDGFSVTFTANTTDGATSTTGTGTKDSAVKTVETTDLANGDNYIKIEGAVDKDGNAIDNLYLKIGTKSTGTKFDGTAKLVTADDANGTNEADAGTEFSVSIKSDAGADVDTSDGENVAKMNITVTTTSGTYTLTDNTDGTKGTVTNANGDTVGELTYTPASGSSSGSSGTSASTGVSISNTYGQGSRDFTYANSITLQVGARSKDAVEFTFNYSANGLGELKADMDASARGLGTKDLDLTSQKAANFAIDKIDNAINKVSMIRGTFGAIQNRLEHKISNLDTNAENLTAAESRIRDTQMDQEMMKFTSAQILSQASQSMLAQANSLPQGVLQLLG